MLANVLDLLGPAPDLFGGEHRFDVQEPGGTEELAHLLRAVVRGEGPVQIEGPSIAVDQGAPRRGAVDLSTRAQ
jgi:hypothetical protein